MATLGDSPSLYQGQSWAYWAERVGFGSNEERTEEEEEDEEEGEGKREGDTMKLRKEDMALFGFCPARDDFYLVVCEICGQVVKPQALKSHIELRHGGVSPPKSEKVEKQSKTVSSQDGASNQLSPAKQTKGGNGLPPVPSPKHSVGSSSSTKSHAKHENKSKRNHSMAPVVRVERISPNMVKRANSTAGNNGGINNSSVPMDKRDIPSPQQPPPVPQPLPPASGGSKKGSAASGASESKPKSASSSKSKTPKERKLLPCKDRVYDANKHCGVWIVEIGKQCTRSLTCKTHSLASRRSVTGRKKNFDELLADHRAAKEALLKSVQAHKESSQCGVTNTNQSNSSATSKSSSGSNKCSNLNGGLHRSPSAMLKPKSSNKLTPASTLKSMSGNSNYSHSRDTLQSCENNSSLSNDRSEDKPAVNLVRKGCDPLYVTHHPNPAGTCTFGARHMGCGFFVFDRRMDHFRTILRTTLMEKTGHPPSKRLCVESKLPPVPDFSDPSDPYTWVDHSSLNETKLNNAVGRTEALSDMSVPVSSVTTSDGLKNFQTKPTKLKPVHNKSHKEPNSNAHSINRTISSTSNAKRKRVNSNASNKSNSLSGITTSAEPTTLPLLPIPITRSTQIGPVKVSSLPSDHKTQVRNNISMGAPGLGTVHTLKNQYANAFRDLNLVVTSVDMANGQIPAHTNAVLGRNIAGIHAITNMTPPGLTVGGGGSLSVPPNKTTQHFDKSSTKKNKVVNKSAKTTTTTSSLQDNRLNMISPYLPSILASGVIVEGTLTPGSLHNAVTLPAVVNNSHLPLTAVGNSILSDATSTSTTTPSPLFRSGSLSPQVPSSSPVPNGLGPSPPPVSTIHTISNHLSSGSTPTISPSGLAESSDLNSIGCQIKVRNSTSRHNTCSPKLASSKAATLHHITTPAHIALSRAATIPQRSTKTTIAASDITFQQVLNAAQISHLHLPSVRNLPTGTPPPLAMPAQLPLKILTTMPTVSVGGASPSQQVHPSFLLQTEELRHQDVQGSSSLHT